MEIVRKEERKKRRKQEKKKKEGKRQRQRHRFKGRKEKTGSFGCVSHRSSQITSSAGCKQTNVKFLHILVRSVLCDSCSLPVWPLRLADLQLQYWSV